MLQRCSRGQREAWRSKRGREARCLVVSGFEADAEQCLIMTAEECGGGGGRAGSNSSGWKIEVIWMWSCASAGKTAVNFLQAVPNYWPPCVHVLGTTPIFSNKKAATRRWAVHWDGGAAG